MVHMFKKVAFKQPKEFKFTTGNLAEAKSIIKKYPKKKQKSAVMPLLYLAQEQHDNWIPIAAMDYIAQLLDITPMHVYEVANFYTMFNKQPVGKHLIQVCRTTPCMLRGAENITNICEKELGIKKGETTADKQFTLVEVECLGACVNAPVVQINEKYVEDLTEENIKAEINKRKK